MPHILLFYMKIRNNVPNVQVNNAERTITAVDDITLTWNCVLKFVDNIMRVNIFFTYVYVTVMRHKWHIYGDKNLHSCAGKHICILIIVLTRLTLLNNTH